MASYPLLSLPAFWSGPFQSVASCGNFNYFFRFSDLFIIKVPYGCFNGFLFLLTCELLFPFVLNGLSLIMIVDIQSHSQLFCSLFICMRVLLLLWLCIFLWFNFPTNHEFLSNLPLHLSEYSDSCHFQYGQILYWLTAASLNLLMRQGVIIKNKSVEKLEDFPNGQLVGI